MTAKKRENKRFYWFKMYSDFFQRKEIKRIRRIAGGEVYLIIYMEMLTRALDQNGCLYYDNVMDDFIDELALDLDETPDNVRMAFGFLQKFGLVVMAEDGNSCYLPELEYYTGSETASTLRSRDSRERKKVIDCNTDASHFVAMQQNCVALQHIEMQCNTDATQEQHHCNTIATDCNTSATNCNALAATCNGEREKEKEIDIEIDREREKKEREEKKTKKAGAFSPPTVEQVRQYCFEHNIVVDAERFVDYYTSKGWYVGRVKMKDWEATLRNWARTEAEPYQPKVRNFVPDVKPNNFNSIDQNQYDFDELESKLLDN